MDDEAAQELCANLPSAELTHPFGFETAVYKVRGKVFALVPLTDERPSITLKIDPEDGIVLARDHAEIIPGYHMNKRHWITVALDGALSAELVTDLIEESYRLVVATLPRAKRPVA